MSSKPPLVLDWDGTLVEQAYPGEGGWFSGAEEALHTLVEHFHLVIDTCRIAPVLMGTPYTTQMPRNPEFIAREVAYIKRMLAESGLQEVQLWRGGYKPPGVAYVDDRGINFNGRPSTWKNLTPRLLAMAGENPYPEGPDE